VDGAQALAGDDRRGACVEERNASKSLRTCSSRPAWRPIDTKSSRIVKSIPVHKGQPRLDQTFLSESLLGDALDRHIRALPMDGRIGKIQLAQDLSLIGPRSASRIKAICEVRNDFAHGLKVLKLSVADYFSQMTEAEFDSLVQRFFASDRSDPSQKKVERPKRAKKTDVEDRRDGRIGKYLFWTCACVALLELSEQQRKIDADRSWRLALVTLGHAFLARQQGDESNARRHMREALDTLEAAAGSRQEAYGDST
jgi:hypothetical protein